VADGAGYGHSRPFVGVPGARARRAAAPRGGARAVPRGAVVLNLTGPAQTGTLEMRLPGENIGVGLNVRIRALRDDRAAETLTGIAEGRLARCILPWVPLMHGGGGADIIEEWKRVAAGETDERLRADYAGLALVFAELTTGRQQWKQALEGWDVRQSQQVLEWQAEARVETKRDDVLRLLRLRFQEEVPTDLAASVETSTDLNELTRWFDAAAVSPSLDAFRNAV